MAARVVDESDGWSDVLDPAKFRWVWAEFVRLLRGRVETPTDLVMGAQRLQLGLADATVARGG